MKTPVVGQLVCSCAGRDQGRMFIVTKVIDEQYVEIADGELRKLDKPKKKKVKHLIVTQDICDTIRAKLEDGKKVFDSEIRSNIEAKTSKSSQDN